jgi:hypothetical protein
MVQLGDARMVGVVVQGLLDVRRRARRSYIPRRLFLVDGWSVRIHVTFKVLLIGRAGPACDLVD